MVMTTRSLGMAVLEKGRGSGVPRWWVGYYDGGEKVWFTMMMWGGMVGGQFRWFGQLIILLTTYKRLMHS